MSRLPHFLCVNPWIHDFAAYDLFYRPLGLLSLAESLAKGPADITVIDLLDRFNPLWSEMCPHDRDTDAGTGHFHREIIKKPAVLENIPRYFSRYGVPRKKAETLFQSLSPKPDAVFITTHMTYWYSGVLETVKVVRQCFPAIPVVLGGIYATLLPNHAQRVIQPDFLVRGNDFTKLQQWLKKRFDLSIPRLLPYHLRKVWDHFPVLRHYPLFTSWGCPYHCAFCAGPVLNPVFSQFPVESILEDVAFAHDKRGLTDFVFYDDALFVNRETHIKPLLKNILQRRDSLTFHSPNGLFARFIDEELAELMAAVNFYEPRLSLETVSPAYQDLISHKVNRKTYLKAVRHLQKAGYGQGDIITYIMMGLPDQTPKEVEETAQVALDAGSRVSLSAFSPVPGTQLWAKSGLCDTDDPLLQNNTVYWYYMENTQDWESLRLRVKEQNARLKE
ncbi:MAG: radical SAM protein [Candidatus Marinimicrobia bacterium]|nr:radical SAM protein [Candidatus Neomarinimicrobiota bacterium]